MKLLCITDPKTHPAFDTTVELYNRIAEHSEIELFHLPVQNVSSSSLIEVARISSPLDYQDFLKLDQEASIKAEYKEFDLVFPRADKPLPEDFYRNLAKFETDVKFVNSPKGLPITSCNQFLSEIASQFLPEFIFSRDLNQIKIFFETNNNLIVAKKNIGYGGKWIYKITKEDNAYTLDNIIDGLKSFSSFELLLDYLFNLDADPYLFVEYLKNVAQGDKRVLVVDGEVYGGYLRQSSTDSWINNITSGGTAHLADITAYERDVIQRTSAEFKKYETYTLGYDFLLDNNENWILSEINVGNIGGYGRLEELSGKAIYERLLDWLISFAA